MSWAPSWSCSSESEREKSCSRALVSAGPNELFDFQEQAPNTRQFTPKLYITITDMVKQIQDDPTTQASRVQAEGGLRETPAASAQAQHPQRLPRASGCTQGSADACNDHVTASKTARGSGLVWHNNSQCRDVLTKILNCL